MNDTSAGFYYMDVAIDENHPLKLVFPDANAAITARAVLTGANYPLNKVAALFPSGVKVVVDVGANAGSFSLRTSFLWPGTIVFAFEPGALSYTCLARNLAPFHSVRCFNYGLGVGDHSFVLNPSKWGTVGSSIGTSGINYGDGETIEIKDAGRVMNELDVRRIDILKIDTEGCEIPILESLTDLRDKISVIFIGYHSEEDRRAIDHLLSTTHQLFCAKADMPHRGDLCFIANALAAPWEEQRIVLPSSMSAQLSPV